MTAIFTGGPRGLGYLEIDQRAVDAPLPPGVARHLELPTYTCTHCQTVVALNPLPNAPACCTACCILRHIPVP